MNSATELYSKVTIAYNLKAISNYQPLKIFAMNKLTCLACLFFLAACSENKVADMSTTSTTDSSFNIDGKKVVVYTTADSTSYRLSATDTLSFADFDQPLE